MIRSARDRLLRLFGVIEEPAAWVLLAGAAVTFVGVLVRLIDVGDFRLATLLVAADLLVSGFTAVQSSDDEEPAALMTLPCPDCGRPVPVHLVRSYTLNGVPHAEVAVDAHGCGETG